MQAVVAARPGQALLLLRSTRLAGSCLSRLVLRTPLATSAGLQSRHAAQPSLAAAAAAAESEAAPRAEDAVLAAEGSPGSPAKRAGKRKVAMFVGYEGTAYRGALLLLPLLLLPAPLPLCRPQPAAAGVHSLRRCPPTCSALAKHHDHALQACRGRRCWAPRTASRMCWRARSTQPAASLTPTAAALRGWAGGRPCERRPAWPAGRCFDPEGSETTAGVLVAGLLTGEAAGARVHQQRCLCLLAPQVTQVGWSRSSRTDKSVHSVATVVGLRMEVRCRAW